MITIITRIILAGLPLCLIGCQLMPIQEQDRTIEPQIIEAIAIDLFGIVFSEISPSQAEVTILPAGANSGEKILDKLMRQSGYKVRTAGVRNVTTLNVYHMDKADTYIGTITIGLYTRFTRQYRYYPKGLVQIGSTAIGS